MEALAVFQYLTSAQLIRLLPNVSTSTVNRYLRSLKRSDKPAVRSLHFGFAPGKGPLAPVYCLTDKGVKWLAEYGGYALEDIKRPLGRSCFFTADYYHRVATIDFKISFIKWILEQGFQLNFYHCYFEREGSNNSMNGLVSKSKAAIQLDDVQIIPDAVIGYKTPSGNELILFEQHMGSDAKRAIRQILQHCWFLSQGAVSKKYHLQKNSRILYVFERQSCMQAVKDRLKQVSGFSQFEQCFGFMLQGSDIELGTGM